MSKNIIKAKFLASIFEEYLYLPRQRDTPPFSCSAWPHKKWSAEYIAQIWPPQYRRRHYETKLWPRKKWCADYTAVLLRKKWYDQYKAEVRPRKCEQFKAEVRQRKKWRQQYKAGAWPRKKWYEQHLAQVCQKKKWCEQFKAVAWPRKKWLAQVWQRNYRRQHYDSEVLPWKTWSIVYRAQVWPRKYQRQQYDTAVWPRKMWYEQYEAEAWTEKQRCDQFKTGVNPRKMWYDQFKSEVWRLKFRYEQYKTEGPKKRWYQRFKAEEISTNQSNRTGSNDESFSTGTMIQSQPINLATNSSSRQLSEAFLNVESGRQDIFPTSSRNFKSNDHQIIQAQDLSMNSIHNGVNSEAMGHNNLLDFCNIILAYTNYPEAFREEYKKPISQVLEAKRKLQPPAKSKAELEETFPQTPQKRKLPTSSHSNVKQKPGRKPGATKATGKVASRLRVEGKLGYEAEDDCTGIPNKIIKLDESRVNGRRRERKLSSPLNSVGESARDSTHSSSSSTSSHQEERDCQSTNLFYPDERKEGWNEVTCFCGKPFAGRPMIECENCFVWHHMSCEKLRKSNVPKNFYCRDCKHLFPDAAEERRRCLSGNHGDMNNLPNAASEKANKDGSSSSAEPLTSLIIPSSMINDQSLSPKSPPSIYFAPKVGNSLSVSPNVITTTTGSVSIQFHDRDTLFANGHSSEPKSAVNGSKSLSYSPAPSRKLIEKTKRRPTLNSASSGLYDDVLLPLRLNFSSVETTSNNNVTSS